MNHGEKSFQLIHVSIILASSIVADLTPEEYRDVIERFVSNSVGHGKHCARNAISHVKRAWQIQELDPEMAVFRAVTAEEEAATAIFHSLKRHNYQGAKRLRHRDHVQKAAVYPFLLAIGRTLAKSPIFFFTPQLIFDESGPKPRIRTRVTVPGPLWAHPDPPLHFDMKVNDQPYDFSDEIKELVSERNAESIVEYIKRRANRRNRILYASPKGVPGIASDISKFLYTQREIVFTNLTVFLLIDPYAEKQDFVQQSLFAFLRMLELLPKLPRGDITLSE